MNIKVNVLREPVKSYNRTKFESTLESGFGWAARFTEDQIEELKERIISKKDKRLEYESFLYESIFVRMKHKMPKTEPFMPGMLQDQDEVLKAFSRELTKLIGIDRYKPSQKNLTDDLNEKRAKSSNKKKGK